MFEYIKISVWFVKSYSEHIFKQRINFKLAKNLY